MSNAKPVIVHVPVCDMDDPGSLEAWYGPFGFFEFWRKVVLANCREIERAKATVEQRKYTVDMIDDSAHLNPIYLDFLIIHLQGRERREDMARSTYGR